jgi:hypothetical protein
MRLNHVRSVNSVILFPIPVSCPYNSIMNKLNRIESSNFVVTGLIFVLTVVLLGGLIVRIKLEQANMRFEDILATAMRNDPEIGSLAPAEILYSKSLQFFVCTNDCSSCSLRRNETVVQELPRDVQVVFLTVGAVVKKGRGLKFQQVKEKTFEQLNPIFKPRIYAVRERHILAIQGVSESTAEFVERANI